MKQHFTAWLVNDPSCLDQPFVDVAVIEDVAISYREVVVSEEYDPEKGQVIREIEEVPEWASQGKEMFRAVTTVEAHKADVDKARAEAEELLSQAGWRIVGEWQTAPSAYTVTTEKDE